MPFVHSSWATATGKWIEMGFYRVAVHVDIFWEARGIKAQRISPGLPNSRNFSRRLVSWNVRISELWMHKQRDLVELWMIHYSIRTLMQPKTDPKSGRMPLKFNTDKLTACNWYLSSDFLVVALIQIPRLRRSFPHVPNIQIQLVTCSTKYGS